MAVKKFELEQVLSYRRDMEKMRKQEFAVAKQQLEAAADILEKEKFQVSKISKEFQQKQSQIQTIDELKRYVSFFAKKKEDIIQQKEHLQYLDNVMNERREDLLVATKDKKVLESLKDKKNTLLKAYQLQKERNFLDEISIQKNSGKA